MRKKIKNLFSCIGAKLRKISSRSPIVLFDTSAIIELGNVFPGEAHNLLQDFDREYSLVFPDLVLGEIASHNANYRIAGRKEISDRVVGLIVDAANRNCGLVSQAYQNEVHDIDLIRYNAYWATREALVGDDKKTRIDPPSEADRSLVELSFLLSADCLRKETQVPVRVISRDSHVLESIRFLNKHKSILHTEQAPYESFDVMPVYFEVLR